MMKMLYILAGVTGTCALICAAELLARLPDRTGIMDRLFKLFDLPMDTKVIYVDFEKERMERHG